MPVCELLMDWIQLFEDSSIEYVTRSPNTKRGEVSVKCPWCGSEDPSFHLGVNLTNEVWGCHRNVAHRGKSPIRLIAALLGVSTPQARLIAAQYGRSDPDTLLDFALTSEAPKADERAVVDLSQFEGFKLIRPDGTGTKYWDYLASRGFHCVADLVFRYGLRYTTTGRWKDRILIPINDIHGLVGWTGRAITPRPVVAPRYLSSSSAIKSTLWQCDVLYQGGDVLFVCEGPVDAMKVDYYGRPYGAKATCVFGTHAGMEQLSILSKLRHRFGRIVLLFDPDAVEQIYNVSEWLPNVVIGAIPSGVEDPGALASGQIKALVESSKR